MKYSKIIEDLNSFSLFDLYRIKTAIENELDNPKRIGDVKSAIRPGMKIKYFEPSENRLVEAVILEIKISRALVKNIHDGANWNIPFHMINLENVDTNIQNISAKKGLTKNQCKVGDEVGFSGKSGEELYGIVVKLNQKRAKIKIKSGETWVVPYSMLFKIFETFGEKVIDVKLIEQE